MAALQPCFVDTYAPDGVKPADVATLVAAGNPWCGMILQTSNGLAYVDAAGRFSTRNDWFNAMWPELLRAAGPRAGIDWFRGGVHYQRVDQNAKMQAEHAVMAVEAAGGFSAADLWLAIDIERGEQPADATAARVEDSVSTTAARMLALTGRAPMVYAGSYTRDLGIRSRMGCWGLWFPEWTGTLSWPTVNAMGFDIATTQLWQIVGDGSNTAPPGYPHLTPIGPLDISVQVRANLPYSAALEWTRTHIGSQPV